jgi:hypothetical protein
MIEARLLTWPSKPLFVISMIGFGIPGLTDNLNLESARDTVIQPRIGLRAQSRVDGNPFLITISQLPGYDSWLLEPRIEIV